MEKDLTFLSANVSKSLPSRGQRNRWLRWHWLRLIHFHFYVRVMRGLIQRIKNITYMHCKSTCRGVGCPRWRWCRRSRFHLSAMICCPFITLQKSCGNQAGGRPVPVICILWKFPLRGSALQRVRQVWSIDCCSVRCRLTAHWYACNTSKALSNTRELDSGPGSGGSLPSGSGSPMWNC